MAYCRIYLHTLRDQAQIIIIAKAMVRPIFFLEQALDVSTNTRIFKDFCFACKMIKLIEFDTDATVV